MGREIWAIVKGVARCWILKKKVIVIVLALLLTGCDALIDAHPPKRSIYSTADTITTGRVFVQPINRCPNGVCPYDSRDPRF